MQLTFEGHGSNPLMHSTEHPPLLIVQAFLPQAGSAGHVDVVVCEMDDVV